MSPKEIKAILDAHWKWLKSEEGGKRANIYDADLSKANLSGANLSEASLYGANLYKANLSGANLSEASLYGASLYGANLSEANLSGANLSGANLSEADLYGANLYRANLYGAKINWRSHQLISEILLRSAEDSVPRRMIAGLIRISTDWCWDKLMEIRHKEKKWALDELKKWVKDGDDAPEFLTGKEVQNEQG